MKRRSLFEFSDLNWWPNNFRALLTDFLSFLEGSGRTFQPHCDLIVNALQLAGVDQVIDLCSGMGGPWPHLREEVERIYGRPISVLLTDKFPNPALAGREICDRVFYKSDPVDALSAPQDRGTAWSLFNAFHHFQPHDARRLLQNAVDGDIPILIFEMLRRNPWDVLAAFLLLPFTVLLLTPQVRPRTFWRFLFTYLIPIAPLTIAWDGAVSVLRCYTPNELLALAVSLEGHRSYVWKAGSCRRGIVSVTYLVGYPEQLTNLRYRGDLVE